MRPALLALLIVVAALPGDGPSPATAKLDATLWLQSAAEAKALALQVWQTASGRLDAALGDPRWTACVEQSAVDGYEQLPPAVIVDVDETVLDNSPYQARLVLDGASYASSTWKSWVEEKKAGPLPGSLAFLQEAAQRGIAVYYVTNRAADLEEATRKNLAQWGFPLATGFDCVLCKNEKPEWSSDKTTRRARIALRHRVLFLFGDDLGDFLPKAKRSPAERHQAVNETAGWWGSRWFMLPNPTYGSWERSLLAGGAVGDETVIDLKRRQLDPRR